MYTDRLSELGNAVVKLAADDYRAALKLNNKKQIEELEAFFTGDAFNLWTKLNGTYVMNRIKGEF